MIADQLVGPPIAWFDLSPLLILLGGGLALLVLGALTPRWPRGLYAAFSATIAGAAIVMCFVLWDDITDEGSRTLVGGAIAFDRFAMFATIAICAAVLIASLITGYPSLVAILPECASSEYWDQVWGPGGAFRIANRVGWTLTVAIEEARRQNIEDPLLVELKEAQSAAAPDMVAQAEAMELRRRGLLGGPRLRRPGSRRGVARVVGLRLLGRRGVLPSEHLVQFLQQPLAHIKVSLRRFYHDSSRLPSWVAQPSGLGAEGARSHAHSAGI